MRNLFRNAYIILLSAVCIVMMVSCTPKAEKADVIKLKERTSDGTIVYDIYYKDDYFRTDGGIYQPSLVTCSYGLAISSFAYYPYKNDYRMQYKTALDFMKAAGFEEIRSQKGEVLC